MKTSSYNKYILLTTILWTLIVATAFMLKLKSESNQISDIIKNEALTTVNKDKTIALWLMQHDKTELNEKNTSATLQNFAQTIGIKANVISKQKFDELQSVDLWLYEAAKKLESNRTVQYVYTNQDSEPFAKIVSPMLASAKCLACHHNVKDGDLIGAITLLLPMKSYDVMRKNIINNIILFHSLALLIGWLFIAILYVITKRYIESAELAKLQEIEDYEATLKLMVNVMEERDAYTAGHAERVANYSKLIAQKLNLNSEQIDILTHAAMLHDIGKIAIPDTILLKPGSLNANEYAAIQTHVDEGYRIISQIQKYKPIAEIIRYHHERFDGTGYPYGKKANEIPIESAIMVVADSFDAMTTSRIYKPRKSIDEAIEEIRNCAGKQFNPDVAVAACEALINADIPEHVSQLKNTIQNAYKLAFYYMDAMTSLYNFDYLQLFNRGVVLRYQEYQFAHLISIRNMSTYNKNYGWELGDTQIKKVSSYLLDNYKTALCFRIYGDIFIIIDKKEIGFDANNITIDESLSIVSKNIPIEMLKSFEYSVVKNLDI